MAKHSAGYRRGGEIAVTWTYRVVTLLVATLTTSLICAQPAPAAPVSFVGDYQSGDFSQWPDVQNATYNGPGKDFVPTSSARLVADDTYGVAARFEVLPGEPNEHGTQRSEVKGGRDTGGTEGDVMWYQFATKFHTAFPKNHAELGQGITNQFWAVAHAGPPLSWSVGKRNGFWSLSVQKQSKPGDYERSFSIFHTPIDVGKWHDVTMQIRWSSSDERGWIRLWMDGKRQTFLDGSDTFRVRTLIPGTKTVRYKEGYYRDQSPRMPAGVVYHAGFRCGPEDPPV